MKLLIFFSLVFFAFSLIVVLAEEVPNSFSPSFISPDTISNVNIVSNTQGYDFNFEKGGSMDLNGKTFFGAKEGSYISTDKEGDIVKAELTATSSATWFFDNKQYDVPAGSKLLYDNGQVKIMPSTSSSEFKITNSDKSSNRFKLNEGSSLIISKDGLLSGKNFDFEGMNIQGRFGNEGKIEIFDKTLEKYNLYENSQLTLLDSGLVIRTPHTNSVKISFQDYRGSESDTSFISQTLNNWKANTLGGEGLEVEDNNEVYSLSNGASATKNNDILQYDSSKGSFSITNNGIKQFDSSSGRTVVNNILYGNFNPKYAKFLSQNINTGDGKWYETVNTFSGSVRGINIIPQQIDDNYVRPIFNRLGFDPRFIIGLYSPSSPEKQTSSNLQNDYVYPSS